MNPSKYFPAILAALLLIMAGCAHLPKKEAVSAGVVKTASTIRFTGYTTTVEIKGSPEEVGKYLLEPKNLLGFKSNVIKYEIPTNKIFKSVGDTYNYFLTFAALRMKMIAILVTYNAGEEVAIFFTGENGVLADLHLYLEPFQGGTKVRLKYENEDISPGLQEMQETLNVHELTAQFFKWAVAKGQQHFDPSLKPEDLLKKGIRGEFYDPIYDAYKETIWIQVPPKKVYEYLTGPGLEKYDAEYGSWMGKLFFNTGNGPIPAKINTHGIKLELTGFPGTVNPRREIRHPFHGVPYLAIWNYRQAPDMDQAQKRRERINHQLSHQFQRGGSVRSLQRCQAGDPVAGAH